MHIRRKKAFRQLFRLIREIEAHPDDLASVRELNLLVLKEVLRDEQGLLRHRETQRALNMQLKTGRGSKEASAAIRARLKRITSYIAARERPDLHLEMLRRRADLHLPRQVLREACPSSRPTGEASSKTRGSFPARRGCSRKRTWYAKSSITACQRYCATLPTLFATATSAYWPHRTRW